MAAAVADRVVLLEEGEIAADGDPVAILGSASLFTPQVAQLFPGTGWLTAEDALLNFKKDTDKTEKHEFKDKSII